jgi:hypothetical protein
MIRGAIGRDDIVDLLIYKIIDNKYFKIIIEVDGGVIEVRLVKYLLAVAVVLIASGPAVLAATGNVVLGSNSQSGTGGSFVDTMDQKNSNTALSSGDLNTMVQSAVQEVSSSDGGSIFQSASNLAQINGSRNDVSHSNTQSLLDQNTVRGQMVQNAQNSAFIGTALHNADSNTVSGINSQASKGPAANPNFVPGYDMQATQQNLANLGTDIGTATNNRVTGSNTQLMSTYDANSIFHVAFLEAVQNNIADLPETAGVVHDNTVTGTNSQYAHGDMDFVSALSGSKDVVTATQTNTAMLGAAGNETYDNQITGTNSQDLNGVSNGGFYSGAAISAMQENFNKVI